jgi:hypothetical protein
MPTERVPVEDLPSNLVPADDLPGGPQPPPKKKTSAVTDFVGSAWDRVNPVEGIKGVADAVAHPVQASNAYVENIGNSLKAAKESFDKGDYLTAARHAVLAGSPLEQESDQAQRGEYAKAAGGTAGIAANLLAPKVIEGIKPGVGKTAESLARRSLKPTGDYASRSRAVKAMLDEDIPNTQKGLDKLKTQYDATEQNLQDAIAKGTPDEIPGSTQRAVDATTKLENVDYSFPKDVAGAGSREMVGSVREQFLDNLRATKEAPPRDMTGPEMHTAKRGVYDKIRTKQGYAPETAADRTEAALARSFMEDVKANFPGVADYLKREGGQIELMKQLQKSLANEGNQQPLGYGAVGAVLGGTADVVAGTHGAGAPAGFLIGYGVKTIQSRANLSRLALLLHKAQRIPVPQAFVEAGAYLNQVGNQFEEREQATQARNAKP